MAVLSENADKIGDRIERGHGRIWSARLDVAKTILSLASAALVLTLTFSDSLLPEGATALMSSLIASAWLMLLLCCASALLALWMGVKLRATPAMLKGQAEAAYEHVLAEARGENFDLRDALRGAPFHEAFAALETADRNSYRFTGAALALLLLSLALLAAAGMVHFGA